MSPFFIRAFAPSKKRGHARHEQAQLLQKASPGVSRCVLAQTRAYPGAPVATPLAWNEVTPRLKPEQFHIGNVLARFDRVGDLFEGVLKRPQSLEKAIEKLAGG